MNAKGHTWNENILTVSRPKQKRARVNNLVKWDRPLGGGTNVQSK